jgi:hypothetical protein
VDGIFLILGGKENLFESKLEGGKRKEWNNDDKSIDYKTSHIGHFRSLYIREATFEHTFFFSIISALCSASISSSLCLSPKHLGVKKSHLLFLPFI